MSLIKMLSLPIFSGFKGMTLVINLCCHSNEFNIGLEWHFFIDYLF